MEKGGQACLHEAEKIPKAGDSSGGPPDNELRKSVLETVLQSKEKRVRRSEVMRILDLSES